jgi:hypothetical protein
MNSIKTAAALWVTLAVIGLVAASGQAAGAARLESRKAAILKRLDERITHLQDERVCFQAATSVDAMKACREKFQMTRPHSPQNPGRAGSIQ